MCIKTLLLMSVSAVVLTLGNAQFSGFESPAAILDDQQNFAGFQPADPSPSLFDDLTNPSEEPGT